MARTRNVARTVGRYEILEELGRGGMATVFLAHQTDLDRSVALKELSAFRQSDPSFVQRFLRESRLAGSLSHPNIVTVLDYFEDDGTPYIAMEYVDGGSLRPHIGHLSLTQVAGVLEGMLSALDHAVTSGKASYVGISNYSGWQAAQAATWQRAVPGRAPLASTQVEYSLVNRKVEAEVLPAAEALGLGVLPWSPLGRGVLTGKYRHGTPADSRAASPHFSNFVGTYLGERHARIVEAVARAAEGLDWSPLEVALTWVRDRPGVTAPIVGARTAAQLRGSLTVEECELPPQIVAALDDVSGGDSSGE